MDATTFSDFLHEIDTAYNQLKSDQLDAVIRILEESFHHKKFVYIFGNGGSGAAASHFCEDIGKGTLTDIYNSGRFRVISLTDNLPYILAWANDNGYETVFEQQLRNFAEPGDVAIGISGSGNSENVIRAIEYANSIGMKTIGFTGYNGGKLGKLVQTQMHVPSFNMGLVESVHMTIMHYIVIALKEKLNPK